jgi:suppressor of cytokine signaling 6/7
LTCNEAQLKLKTQPNGSFLVRDSQTKKYQFTLSFRSAGKTLHCRIDYIDGYWTYIERFQFDSVHELIEETMRRSQDSVFGFVKQNSRLQPPFPVRLTKPINRFYEVSTLQHLCRFIIRQKIDIPYVNSLPLPDKLKDYVKEYDDSNDNVQDN